MVTWWSATAVVPQLEVAWALTASEKAWLTIAVSLGFVLGALISAALNLADRFRGQLIVLVGCVGAGLANLGLVLATGPELAISLRFVTGVFMAAVYPPSFKLISTWFHRGRGTALGVLAAGILVGNATPHLVNAVGGVRWENVIYATSILSLLGGVFALTVRDGPFSFPSSDFDPRQMRRVFANRGVRLASVGYFGHMWELFAMYAWLLIFLGDHFVEVGAEAFPVAPYLMFAVGATGALGSWVAGLLADRWGRSNTTILMLGISGLCSLTIGLLFGGATWAVVAVSLIWGFAVVADSAQFSAVVTETADPFYVGTALTMQIAIGFTITVPSLWLIPILVDLMSWRWVFTILALGPAVGIVAMARLKRSPEAAFISSGRG